MTKRGKDKQESKRKVGRPEKRIIESIPDTPENVAKALFGITPDGKKVKVMKPELKRNKNTISWKEVEEIRRNSYRRRAEERIIERAVKAISKHI